MFDGEFVELFENTRKCSERFKVNDQEEEGGRI